MAATGRVPKLTPEIQDAICKAIIGGLTYEQAAQFNGITATTFYNWKAKGEKATKGIYVEFLESIKKANVQARALHLQRIQKASQGGNEFEETSETIKTERNDKGVEVVVARETRVTKKKTLPQWQASAWILERRFPSEYGRHVQPQVVEEHDPLDEWLDGLNEAEAKYSADEE